MVSFDLSPHTPNMKDIESFVNYTITNYQLTSRLKLHKLLRTHNVKRISESLTRNGRQAEQFFELIRKRDYYNGKIYELLNSAAEQDDPALISDRDEAERYIRKRIMKDHHKVSSIKALIEKHARFQQQYKQEKQSIVDSYSGSTIVYDELKKLNAIKLQLAAKQNMAKESALQEIYLRAAKEQRELSDESQRTLRLLGIPFFAAETQDQGNKLYVLELLQSQLKN